MWFGVIWLNNYNTAINPLGSIPDINIIIETIKDYGLKEDLARTKEEFIQGNAFGFNLSSSRKRFFSVIKKIYLNNLEHVDKKFFINTISSNIPATNFKKAILYLETCRNNDLFCELSCNLIYNKHLENRRLITSGEIFDWLQDFGRETKISDWSESTVKIICSKYISFLRRLGYLSKEKGHKSSFSFPYPDEKIITYLVYLLITAGKTDNQTYNSNLYRAFLLSEEEKIELLKKGSLAGYYNFNLSGNKNAVFELTYDREEVIDELFR